MTPVITLNASDAVSARKALEALTLSPKQRFWLLKDLGRWEIRQTKSRLRRQKDTEGRPFEKRKRGEDPVLSSFADGMEPYVEDRLRLNLTWKSKGKARKAAANQLGNVEQHTAASHVKKMNKRFGEPDYQAPATDNQAVALRRLGYKMRRKGGGYNRLSKRNIAKRMTLGQAGLIIRMMRTGSRKGKQNWTIENPQRQFLGTDKERVRNRLLQNIEKARQRR
ncbi:hypothetical protein C9I92_15105 [Photobacterium ganghwense]|uniref:Virion morphogenesis protein n=1 Tax=Photobacterium ganghwense TaxID=320778 RepID=A0A0J1H8B5_9GAMM|nr:hypothetical protein [Photobacterium ganghwense]KLV07975.1 hypothetical protein ABT57_14095 [Photobacterium ganghwense]PSU07081.1 hypothetical protein C9I92_15105 [Photobacterium ganghwense]QSV15836.1 hypothetical protein FH974_21525 [Photobacterium ganghwense]